MPGPDDIALAVGIDGYEGNPLKSCVADADEISRLLEQAGDEEGTRGYDVEKITVGLGEVQITREEVLDELVNCLDRAERHDFVFYYSGHGTTNEWGTELVVGDDAGILETVSMHEVLTLIQRAAVRQAVVILDCCYSGSFARDPVFTPRASRFEAGPSLLPENFTLLAASQGGQPAYPGKPYSAFTGLIVEGLRGGAADHNGHITATSLFGYAAPAFSPLGQRPLLKANLGVNHPVRTVSIPVHLELLRALSVHFPPGTDEVTLAPTDVVALGDDPATPQQERYVQLVELREHGLLRSPDSRHLSELAADGATVTLSARGFHLRLLAARNAI